MTRKNLYALALAATLLATTSAAHAAAPFHFVHLHPGANAKQDGRITFTLANKSGAFCDVKVDGHVYTVQPGQALRIKAAIGTIVYADANILGRRRGDVLVKVDPSINNSTVRIG